MKIEYIWTTGEVNITAETAQEAEVLDVQRMAFGQKRLMPVRVYHINGVGVQKKSLADELSELPKGPIEGS
jgi:hypothetical protein